MHRTTILIGIIAACALVGCAKKEAAPDPLPAQVKALEQRVAELESANKKLATTITALSSTKPSAVPAPEAESTNMPAGAAATLDQEALQAMIAEQVEALVIATVNEQAAAEEAQGEAQFAEAFVEQMGAWEERKDAERKERDEQRRKQWEQERAERQKKQFDGIATKLGLNEDQRTNVEALAAETRDATRETMELMRADGRYSQEDYRAAFEEIRTQQQAAMREILSDEQYAAFEKEYDGRLSTGFDRGGFGGRRRGR